MVKKYINATINIALYFEQDHEFVHRNGRKKDHSLLIIEVMGEDCLKSDGKLYPDGWAWIACGDLHD